jgi:uncharacterized membrane protein YhaH (DUF805 family)
MKYFRFFKGFQNYDNFSGRASRIDFWSFTLINTLFAWQLWYHGFYMALAIYYIVVAMPQLTVGVRRMHDVGKSGLFLLIPVLNVVLLFMRGNKGDNKYGINLS